MSGEQKALHTPGPWSFGYSGATGYCVYGGGQHIGTSTLYKKYGGEANARLMAAAPDLLEALQDLFGADMEHVLMGDGKDDQIEAIAKGRAAIAKALGQST